MRVLITGANRGLGLEFVRQLLPRGERVFATCRNPEAAEALQALKAEYPEQLTITALDVADPATIDAAVAAISAETEALDLLINNAGIGGPHEKLGTFEQSAMVQRFVVNAVGPVLTLQGFLPLLKAGEDVKVVNVSTGISSIATRNPNNLDTYCASKAALNMYTKGLSFELRNYGIAVIVMDPGWVQTDMGGPGAEITPEESINGMLQVIEQMSLATTGHFFHYTGEELPW